MSLFRQASRALLRPRTCNILQTQSPSVSLSFQIQSVRSFVTSSSPFTAQASSGSNSISITKEELEAYQKRVSWRCRQRGMLELDLILGSWADINIKKLNLAHLNEFEAIVEQETPVTMAMLLDPAKTPEEMEKNEILQVIRDYMKNSTKVWMPAYGEGNQ